MSETRTVNPLPSTDRVQIEAMGWHRVDNWRWERPDGDAVEYDTRRFGWFAVTPTDTRGPFSTVWAAIDGLGGERAVSLDERIGRLRPAALHPDQYAQRLRVELPALLDITARLRADLAAAQERIALLEGALEEIEWLDPRDAHDALGIARRALLSAPTAAAPVDWQPIETAPKDGKEALAWDGQFMWLARWAEYANDGRGAWFADQTDRYGEDVYCEGLTHWRPLPAAPTASARGEG